jgi:hypothetical protein
VLRADLSGQRRTIRVGARWEEIEGLSSVFVIIPPPSGLADRTNVLDGNFLLPLAAISLQSLGLHDVSARRSRIREKQIVPVPSISRPSSFARSVSARVTLPTHNMIAFVTGMVAKHSSISQGRRFVPCERALPWLSITQISHGKKLLQRL